MEKQFEDIREQQKKSWDHFSSVWKKWNAVNMAFLQPVGEAIISVIDPGGTDKILDIAAGTGEPGLTIAGMLSGGKVFLTDLSGEMLALAAANAASRGIRNIETTVCDVCELPFTDNCFDGISARFGFMYFPDMQLAANEITRVLKPGGRFATSVWNGPDKNFWTTTIMGVIAKNIELPPPIPGAPGLFRCAQPGLMKSIFEKAGLKNITEKIITPTLKLPDQQAYWDMMTEVSPPIVAALGKVDPATIETIKQQTFDLLTNTYKSGEIAINASATVISGEK